MDSSEIELNPHSNISLTDRVFLNDLIFENISKSLSPLELRIGRQVSSDWDAMVRRSIKFNKFIRSITLHVNENTCQNHGIIKNTKIHWKVVELDLSVSKIIGLGNHKLLDIISQILASVETLRLTLTDFHGALPEISPFLVSLLKSCYTLTDLEVHPVVIGSLDFQPVLSCNEVLEIISEQMKSFKILSVDSLSYYLETERYLSLSTNLIHLSSCPPLRRLKCFHWSTETKESQLFHTKDQITHKMIENLPKLLALNANTLENISLTFDVWTLMDMTLINLYKLKSLDTSVRKEDCRLFATFLRNHPQLEELVIDIRYVLDKDILNVIADKFSMLRKLHLTTAAFERLLTGHGVDLTFLSRMVNLEDFSFILLGRKPGGSLLSNVIRKLPESLKTLTIGGYFADLESDEKLELLEPFVNLQCLKLRCSNFVDDQVLQWILRNMRWLQILEITDGPALTHFGITGQCQPPSTAINHPEGTAFANLKELSNLTINWEGHISLESIGEAVSSDSIVHFTFRNKSDNNPVTPDIEKLTDRVTKQNLNLLWIRIL